MHFPGSVTGRESATSFIDMAIICLELDELNSCDLSSLNTFGLKILRPLSHSRFFGPFSFSLPPPFPPTRTFRIIPHYTAEIFSIIRYYFEVFVFNKEAITISE